MSQFVSGGCIVYHLKETLDDGFLFYFWLCRLLDLKVEMGMNSLLDFGWGMFFQKERMSIHSLLDFGWCIVYQQ